MPRLFPYSNKRTSSLPWFLWILCFLCACGPSKSLFKENPKTQHYADFTDRYFSKPPTGIQSALFAALKHGPGRDLLLITAPRQTSGISAWMNDGKGKFAFNPNSGLSANLDMDVIFAAMGDLNRDGGEDLIVIGISKSKTAAKILLNNKKGYFYVSESIALPAIRDGVERVDLVDIDRDRDIDLIFTGRNLLNDEGTPARNQVLIMLNDGKGRFSAAASILLPPLKSGAVGTSIADYDGDEYADIFLLYESGENVLLINNGLGEFADTSDTGLPRVAAKNRSADWADFDGDGDNDILVVTAGIDKRQQAFPGEFCYFLENDGKGHFTKRSLKMLPQSPSHKVYLLDADGNKTADSIVLSDKGTHFLINKGKWVFADETRKRIPYSARFDEMTFGDVDGNGHLDIFGILSNNKEGRLWLTLFD